MASVMRLLDRLRPQSYGLELEIDMEAFRYTAKETIAAELVEASHSLTLHASGLEISHASLVPGQLAQAITLNPEDQTVTFTFEEELAAGELTLKVEFSGEISESLHGFYRSSYEQAGKKHWLATTQFEAVHAREAFVCIDEPAAKATFQLDMIIPEHLSAISNMHLQKEQSLPNGQKRLSFAPTPQMSTYLAAYVIGEFEHVEATTPEGVKVRVYATPGKTSQLAFALETAVRTLSFYTDYFGIGLPLEKLDMIAVPDFASGAMENWGAITYRETALLLDANQTTPAQRQRVAEVIAHELAHQWFGNLVTMSWWNDLWLNEGFASWVEVLAQDALFPEWQVWQQFVSGDVAAALSQDALASTHPIEVEVEDPRALDEIFDSISYSKGAAIINMLHSYLGAETFRRGLSHYLNQHAYGNAVTNDLWQALEETSGQPVGQVMSLWTQLPGYPVVSLREGSISQQRFFASPYEASKAGTDSPVWPIPFATLLPGNQQTHMRVLTSLKDALIDPKTDWTKPNPGQAGLYRVAYSQEQLDALLPAMQRQDLPAVDRFGVIDDVFAGAEAGLIGTTSGLNLIQGLSQETNMIAWLGLYDGLMRVINIIEDEALRDRLKAFGRWFVQPSIERLGWEEQAGETYFDTLLRPIVLQTAVRFEDQTVVSEAQERFAAYAKTGTVHPSERPILLLATGLYGDESDYEAIVHLYQTATIPQVKNALLSSLSRFQSEELISRTLTFGLSEQVRQQDTIYVLGPALTNRKNRDTAWRFLREQWPEMLRRFGGGGHMLGYLPEYVGMAYASEDKAQEIEAFFTAHPHPAITRPVAQAIEAVRIKADWAHRDSLSIQAFLESLKATISPQKR